MDWIADFRSSAQPLSMEEIMRTMLNPSRQTFLGVASGAPPAKQACQCACHKPDPPVGLVHHHPCCELVTETQVLEEQTEWRDRLTAAWAQYPAYGTVATCRKCGNADVGTKFCSTVARTYMSPMGSGEMRCLLTDNGQRDHLHRMCRQCEFVWVERPLDDETVVS